MMEIVVTSGAIRCAKLQSNCHHKQNITELFTDRKSYMLPDQQRYGTEGKTSHSTDLLTPSSYLLTPSSDARYWHHRADDRLGKWLYYRHL